jgi:hypothetical protein
MATTRSCSAASLVALLALAAACDPDRPRSAEAADLAASHDVVEGGAHWRVTTAHGPVHVWTPPTDVTHAATVIYVHGFLVDVDEAWTEHRLPSQFAASGLPAIFIACEAPSGRGEAVSWTSLAELLATVERDTGLPLPPRVIAVGHSGAHITLRHWLDEPQLDTLVLLDAAYGGIKDFRTWVLGDERRRLIFVGDSTRNGTDRLEASLSDVVVLDRVPALDAERLPASARIIYIKSDLGHFTLITGGVALPAILRQVPTPTAIARG